MNLTAITDPEEILEKHFLDKYLSVLCAFGDGRNRKARREPLSMIDMGTGAGFPAFPSR